MQAIWSRSVNAAEMMETFANLDQWFPTFFC